MKPLHKFVALTLGTPLCALLLNSCGLDEPFGNGQGELHIRMQLNSEVTRAETDPVDLASTVKLYLSQGENLYYKFQGLENVPSTIPFKSGIYTAEAYAGVKSPASFSDKYYEGSTNFEISTGVTNVVLECKIANVVASVNYESIDPALLKNYTITIGHSAGTLDFDQSMAETETKGYFILPNGETDLQYTVEGENADGIHFSKSGTIPNVQKAHEYALNVRCNPNYEEEGGAYIDIEIDDSEVLIESEVTLTAAPDIAGLGFDISKQQSGAKGAFKDQLIRVRSFGELKSLRITGLHNWINSSDVDDSCDLMAATENVVQQLNNAGLSYKSSADANNSSINRTVITLSASLLNSLPVSQEEYALEIEAVDNHGKTTKTSYRLANTEAAVVIDDPVVAYQIDQNADLLAVGARSATLTGAIVDPQAVNPGIRFREAGADNWQFVAANNASAKARKTRAGQNFSIKLSNLKPATRYEYQAIADGFEPSDSFFITTESIFKIPNADMESWSKWSVADGIGAVGSKPNSKVTLPNADGARSFWDTGNHGAAVMSGTLTESDASIFSSGKLSAKLESKYIVIKFAAGNLFTGYYMQTKGTNGVIQFGRPYDSSHPAKLSVMVNYRPAVATNKGGNDKYIPVGAKDQGQIYVALTTAPVQVDTSNEETASFKKDAPEVIAYGQHTFTDAYGQDGKMEKIEIPFEYYQKAKTEKPLYIVIVCSASKYGDFFSGAVGSLMYVDDFELIYE